MISGTVSDLLEATLRLDVVGSSGQPQSIEAVIDTGFSGFLTLPPSSIEALSLTWLCREQGRLADGCLHPFDVYVGIVIWEGEEKEIEIEAAEAEPLIGMALMEEYSLTIHITRGGKVSLDRLT